jgi:integrase
MNAPALTDDKIWLSTANSGALQTIEKPVGDAQIQSLPSAVGQYLSAATSANTRRAYRGDLQDFLNWGGTVPCSPEVLAAYIAARAETHSPYTISRRVVGIGRAHVSQSLPDPGKTDLVRTVLRGVRRTKGGPQRQATPLLKQDLLSLLPFMRGTKGIRDRALILLGFAAALRRSELVALDVEALEFVREGLIVNLRRSKTDQEGVGRKIAVPYGRTSACPVKAVQVWLEHGQIAAGAVFKSVSKGQVVSTERLTGAAVALIVKGYAKAAGLPSTNVSGHSLRSGLVTSAAQIGVSTHKIQQQTGHRSVEMVAKYIRDANLFENNAAGLLL